MLLGVLIGIGISTLYLWAIVYFVTGIKIDSWLELFAWVAMFTLMGVGWNFFRLVINDPVFFLIGRFSTSILIGVILYFIMHMRFGIENEKHKWLVATIYPGSLLILGLLIKGIGLQG